MDKIILTKDDVRFFDELVVYTTSEVKEGYIEGVLELWFDVDKYFGTKTRNEDGTWINAYIMYYPKTKEIKGMYFVSYDNEPEEEHIWELTSNEQKMFKELMEEYSQKTSNKSLDELYKEFE